MAELQSVLGGILRDLTRGRAMGDITSFEVAQMYRQNDLLASFSIPRFRIDEIDLELRFALDSPAQQRLQMAVSDEQSAEFERGADQIVEHTYSEFPEMAKSRQFSETGAVNTIRSVSAEFLKGPLGELNTLAERFATVVEERLREPLAKETKASEQESRKVYESVLVPLLARRLKEAIAALAGGLQTRAAGSLEVIVEAARLAELRPDQISTIRMRLTDNDRMWGSTTLSSGEKVDFITDHG